MRSFAKEINSFQPLKDLSAFLLKVVDKDLYGIYNCPALEKETPKIVDLKEMADGIRRSIAHLEKERDARQIEVDNLNVHIAQLELVLSTLGPLVEDVRLELQEQLFVEGLTDLKLADACRAIVKAGPAYRTARGVRDVLEASGYDLSQHKNPLASIHGVLKRLAEAGEIEETEINGSTRYRRKSPYKAVGVIDEEGRVKKFSK
jgi:hypothetical protein